MRVALAMPSVRSEHSLFRFGPYLVAIVAVAAFLRISTLGVRDLWQDEIHSLLNSAAHRVELEALPSERLLTDVPRYTDLADDSSLSAVWRGMRADSHPPLYFIFLYVWRRLFGDGELALRLPAALISALSVLPVSLILREYGYRWAALGAGLLLSLAYADIRMGQQARPYSLAIFLVGVGYWLLVVMEHRWTHATRRWRIFWSGAYSATLCLAMLTHYFAVLAILGQVVYVLLRFRRGLLRWWVGSAALAAVVFAIVWLPGFLAQLDFIAAQDWTLESRADHIWRTVIRAADLPVRLMFQHPHHDWSAGRIRFMALPGALLLVLAVLVIRHHRCSRALIFLLWYAVPSGALVFSRHAGRKAVARPFALSFPGLRGADRSGRAGRRSPAAAVAACCCGGVAGGDAADLAATCHERPATTRSSRAAARTA